ncbi:hypothetical protein MKX08_004675 [Trichoderma sp. CBMAI-0020]|nr:hypothetical protein MKX08_004675 [Trichoderma sp. CBMAI-0020]
MDQDAFTKKQGPEDGMIAVNISAIGLDIQPVLESGGAVGPARPASVLAQSYTLVYKTTSANEPRGQSQGADPSSFAAVNIA